MRLSFIGKIFQVTKNIGWQKAPVFTGRCFPGDKKYAGTIFTISYFEGRWQR